VIWGQEHFLGEDAPSVLRRRIAATIRSLAARPWLGLCPVARHRRWAIVAAGATARDVYDTLAVAHGNSRPPTDPFLLIEVLRTPDRLDEIGRHRESVHAETLGVRRGDRVGLRLEDWFYLPASGGASPDSDTLLPQLVTVPADDGAVGQWLVKVGYVLIFDDGITLQPEGVDIRAGEIRAVGRLDAWDAPTELARQADDAGAVVLRETAMAERFAPNSRDSRTARGRLRSPKHYACPHCSRRTRIDPEPLIPDVNWNVPASSFPDALKTTFDAFRPVPYLSFDFRCSGCQAPARLLYEYREVGLGGPWHPVITSIIETVEDAS